MAYDIRMFKLVTGELALGKYDAKENALDDVAILQVVPSQQGVQMMMLPYGYPFEQEFKGRLEGKHFLYAYEKLPEGLENKYLESCTNLTLSGVNDMQLQGTAPLSGGIIR